MKPLLLIAAACSLALAQQPTAPPQAEDKQQLDRVLSEASTSPIEYLRAIEKYLAAHPDSIYRPDLERGAASSAIAIHDDALIVRYGELVLARQPDDVPILTRVSHSLLISDSKDAAERALKYARRTEELIHQLLKGPVPPKLSLDDWHNSGDRALARALTDQARASGNLGHREEAVATAQRAFETYPNADSAREIALWQERLGKPFEAARALAGAVTIQDINADSARDRGRMAQLYTQAKGSQQGLGDLFLEAYDHTQALLQARNASANAPNAGRTDPMDFTLSAVEGPPLIMASLKGKVLVLDFWATWCVPCREQHPLYEQVKQRFLDNPAVVFLSINSDSEHQPAKPFLAEMKWQGPVYFEDGLARAFAIDGIPATILMDPRGQVFTRMNGYVKERFVDLLTERIRDALSANPPAPPQ